MCRMLGIASKSDIPQDIFEKFRTLALTGKTKKEMSKHHLDGWGVAGYLGAWAVHFGRSERGAVEDAGDYAAAYRRALLAQSRIVVAHLRKASEGSLTVTNSHPFIHCDWVFCHNGTVHGSEKLIIPRCRYEGTTDSERMFKFIVEKLHRKSVRHYPELVRGAMGEIRQKCSYTSLTFLLSGGGHLIAYRDFREEGDYYTLHYARENGTFLFCSEELPGYAWTGMKNGELRIVDKYGDTFHAI